ncbi:MAG: hydrogenase maturation nickel metallochaperone HypA [Anaerolineales bacterium]|nr:hydrogenase maturation nickel metallochaperone HypA [Anaerolineales bacterium]
MHELSIAYSLVQMASTAAEQEGIKQVTAVHLKLGALSGVIKDALLFSYDIATQNTVLAGSKLIIEDVPVVVNCPNCGAVELPNIQRFRCPRCDLVTADIQQGKELQISALEYEDEGVAEDVATDDNVVGDRPQRVSS